jgi:hypothetical protein
MKTKDRYKNKCGGGAHKVHNTQTRYTFGLCTSSLLSISIKWAENKMSNALLQVLPIDEHLAYILFLA